MDAAPLLVVDLTFSPTSFAAFATGVAVGGGKGEIQIFSLPPVRRVSRTPNVTTAPSAAALEASRTFATPCAEIARVSFGWGQV